MKRHFRFIPLSEISKQVKGSAKRKGKNIAEIIIAAVAAIIPKKSALFKIKNENSIFADNNNVPANITIHNITSIVFSVF